VKTIAALLALALPLAAGGGQDRKSRPFLMGATVFPHDMSEDGIVCLQKFLTDHVDLVSQKLEDGVPWPEALGGSPFAPELDKKIEEAAYRPEGKKLLLSTTPLNGDKNGLAGYRGAEDNLPLPGGWKDRDFDHPEVIRAYTAWCRELIRRTRPDFFVYAMELNQLAVKEPARWKKIVPFCRDVYLALKKAHPELPVFFTIQAEAWHENEPAARRALQQVAAYTDLAAVASLPNLRESNPAKIKKDYYSRIGAALPGKPLAVVQTAFLGEDLALPGLERAGKAAWQDEYLRWLLEDCARLNARFVVWTVPRDYDLLYLKFLAGTPMDFFKIMKDTGLLDGEGRPRKAFETWQLWRALPVK
jgi:hypothetical protein